MFILGVDIIALFYLLMKSQPYNFLYLCISFFVYHDEEDAVEEFAWCVYDGELGGSRLWKIVEGVLKMELV